MKKKSIIIIITFLIIILLINIIKTTNKNKIDYSNPTKIVFESTSYQIEMFLKSNINNGKNNFKGEDVLDSLKLSKDNYVLYINNEIKEKNNCKSGDIKFKLVGKKGSILEGYNSKIKCVNN